MTEFNTIGLIGKKNEPRPRKTLRRLGAFLTDRGLNVLIEDATAEWLEGTRLPIASIEQIGKQCDLAVTVGGDGTLLQAARSMVDHGVPLLGINLGRLGFLADISPDDMLNTLDRILAGEYQEDQRFLLQAEIDGSYKTALNDIVIHKWNTARLIEFETHIDGKFVNAQRSDGLIISTPTGSTAYALSGGGPLLDTALNAIVLVPICPHTLSNRPIVVSGDSRIELRVIGNTDHEHVRITCDGQTCCALESNSVWISKYERQIRLIHPQGQDHFDLLRAKLGWGEHPG